VKGEKYGSYAEALLYTLSSINKELEEEKKRRNDCTVIRILTNF